MNLSLNIDPLRTIIATFTLLALAWFTSPVSAQDMHFTQYNAAPTSINPGYAGATGQARAVTLYRAQWASLPQAYTGFHFAYDRPTFDHNGGIGVLISHEEAGAGALRSSRVALQYAYEFQLGPRTFVRPALQAGVVSRAVNLNGLTFMDQLLRNDAATSLEQGLGTGKQYLDLGTGVLLVSREFWFGASADHINTPNSSLSHDYAEKLAVRFSAHGGGRVPLSVGPKSRNDRDIVLAFNYTNQGLFDQLDIGTYYDLNVMTIGLWYRGIPVLQQAADGSLDIDAVSVIFGFGNKLWRMGYSYDLTLSKLGIATSGGSHEISLKYMWDVNKKDGPPSYHPCVQY
ncbi:MAG TPA: type IX secretion system membrane protein PorP/SprF [Flavobacteriales bacterium]|nr:type IX secretion system membrane protein PorP/SprF [Flavobacteriales bacterium]HIO16331.1 type IX secretion system membrane protein PorP/SprF [Flavobacteriales bacterium]